MQAIKEEYDDLTKITGIGPARKSWLAEVFGVRTYDDLAALSVDDIVAQFRTEGKPYSRSDIELEYSNHNRVNDFNVWKFTCK